MKTITVEEHLVSDELFKRTMKLISSDMDDERKKFFYNRSTAEGKLTEIENYRLPFMDNAGVDIQVLSYVNLNTSGLENDERNKLCHEANEFLKEQVDKYPDRFAAFACLPLWDVEESCKELEKCVKDYGFKGALVQGKFDDHFLDEKQFFPIFEKAAELDVPIHFHPSMPVPEIQDYYYKSNDGSWSDEVAYEFGSTAIGWHLDIGLQVIRMILTGIFDKLPNLKFITGHWGEGMIEMLDRMDYMLPKSMTGLNKNISEYYKEHMYVTPSGIESPINLEAVTKYMGADHIIWAADYPFLRNETVVDFLMDSDLTDEEKELISYKNAEKLLKM